MRIAVVDDDQIELVLLEELAGDFDKTLSFTGYTTVKSFVEGGPSQYDLIFLDRRIPPHTEFSETLPLLTEAGYCGRVILMTAHGSGVRAEDYEFEIVGPVDKLELLDPARLEALIRNL
jgi:DNA-binding NtrC family response regulator